MKIMILVPSFGRASPVHGAFLFAKHLHKNNNDSLFVSLDTNYNSKKNILNEIIQGGVRFDCLGIVGWHGVMLCRSKVVSYIEKNHVDIVLSYLLRPDIITSFLPNVVKISCARANVREYYTAVFGKSLSRLFTAINVNAWKRMDHIFCVSNGMRNWLVSEGLNPQKISKVYNFVDVEELRSFGNENKMDNGKINIGMFTEFYKLKKVDVAIRGIERVIRAYKHNNIVLHLAGRGPLEGSLKKLVAALDMREYVVFHGFLTDPLRLMRKMDLVILTSKSEGIPRCLMEGLSLGKTVIGSNIPGVSELIKDGQTGYLFPCGDIEAFASLVDRIIKQNLFLPGEKLVDFMRMNFDVNICSEKMLQKICTVFGQKKDEGVMVGY